MKAAVTLTTATPPLSRKMAGPGAQPDPAEATPPRSMLTEGRGGSRADQRSLNGQRKGRLVLSRPSGVGRHAGSTANRQPHAHHKVDAARPRELRGEERPWPNVTTAVPVKASDVAGWCTTGSCSISLAIATASGPWRAEVSR